jgi:hypothetical protein
MAIVYARIFFLMFPMFPTKALEHLAKLSINVPKKITK